MKKCWLEVVLSYLVIVTVGDVYYLSHGTLGVDLVLDYLAPDLGNFAHISEEMCS